LQKGELAAQRFDRRQQGGIDDQTRARLSLRKY
jgi:hypothetical protein